MTRGRPRVLVIDDGDAYAQAVDRHLDEFTLVKPAAGQLCMRDAASALKFLQEHPDSVDVLLLDVRFDLPEKRLVPLTPPANLRRTRRFQGVAIFRLLRAHFPQLPIVLLTSVEDLALVDEDGSLAAQSLTYFLENNDLDTLRIRLQSAVQEAASASDDAGVMWGDDPQMRRLRRRLSVLARGRLPVLLEGETGTGKSYLAEHFVHAQSERGGPFVVLDLATVPRDLVPAHLFGAERGAYTGAVADRKGVFEQAHRGTLFIDEVQNIPLEVQKQLLLVLQSGRVRRVGGNRETEVDVKVVAASNKPLSEAVEQGHFRSDLHMRLGPATRTTIPPVRERKGDLPRLLRHFTACALRDPDLAQLCARVAHSVGVRAEVSLQLGKIRGRDGSQEGLTLVLPAPAWKQLQHHAWPGNVREVAMLTHNVVAFTLVAAVDAIHGGSRLTSSKLQVDPGLIGELLATASSEPATRARHDGVRVQLRPARTLNAVSQEVERQYLHELFERTDGDLAAMAERLLGNPGRARAVQLRMNQLGLKMRQLRRP